MTFRQKNIYLGEEKSMLNTYSQYGGDVLSGYSWVRRGVLIGLLLVTACFNKNDSTKDNTKDNTKNNTKDSTTYEYGCMNGTPASGEASTDDIEKCASCNDGYRLDTNNNTCLLNKETIEFPSLDDLEITADLFFDRDVNRPFILMFHQANASRGEFITTAPLFHKKGYNTMAVDLRSGREINQIKNQTAERAVKKSLGMDFMDAEQDMKASIQYVKDTLKVKSLLLLGSSYSASLVIKAAGEEKYKYSAVISFSPGTHFGGIAFGTFAEKINIPAWITTEKSTIPAIDRWIFPRIPSANKVFFKANGEGEHGSRALWDGTSEYESYRTSLFKFLEKHAPTHKMK